MITVATAHAESSFPPARFFERWIDHATWRQWSPDVEWVRFDGPVSLGARGTLKPKGGPRTGFRVGELETDRRYTDVSSLPGARLHFRHDATPKGDGSVLDVRVWLEGPLAGLWNRILGGGFRQTVQPDLDRLIALVESTVVAAGDRG